MRESLMVVEAHLVSALELLDAVSAPADIGAYLDMALHRLKDAQHALGSGNGGDQN